MLWDEHRSTRRVFMRSPATHSQRTQSWGLASHSRCFQQQNEASKAGDIFCYEQKQILCRRCTRPTASRPSWPSCSTATAAARFRVQHGRLRSWCRAARRPLRCVSSPAHGLPGRPAFVVNAGRGCDDTGVRTSQWNDLHCKWHESLPLTLHINLSHQVVACCAHLILEPNPCTSRKMSLLVHVAPAHWCSET